jgi:hypothetical protein
MSSESSKKLRCSVCHKKLGIMPYLCKCERVFCISHLHAEEHECSYSYKESERKELEKRTVVGPLSDKMTDRI